jgi:hypothetical protein
MPSGDSKSDTFKRFLVSRTLKCHTGPNQVSPVVVLTLVFIPCSKIPSSKVLCGKAYCYAKSICLAKDSAFDEHVTINI